MTADEYLALPDDGHRYELIDGVVVMSPSPLPEHQDVRSLIERRLGDHVEQHRLGVVLSEVDVRMGVDLVYRPDLIFLAEGRFKRPLRRVDIAPDLVVEILSPSTAAFDLKTKREDYQRAGVREYWIVDVRAAAFEFLRLHRGTLVETAPSADRLESLAVPGFTLDLKTLRRKCAEYADDAGE
jgi:Uma2 family endonuclease